MDGSSLFGNLWECIVTTGQGVSKACVESSHEVTTRGILSAFFSDMRKLHGVLIAKIRIDVQDHLDAINAYPGNFLPSR